MSSSPERQAPRSAEEQQRLQSALTELFEQRITFNGVLGLKVISLDPQAVRLGLRMKPELVGHYLYGRLHGGATSATLDAVSGLAVMVGIAEHHRHETTAQVMPRFARVGTIDLRVDYLRQGLGTAFEASAEVTRLGGRVASVLSRLVNQDGTLIATGAAAYIVS